jgi:hypothetical protein
MIHGTAALETALPAFFSDLGFWLGGQDSNLDEVLQRHLTYR